MLNPLYLAQCLLYIRQSENVSRMNEWVSGWKNKFVNLYNNSNWILIFMVPSSSKIMIL